LNFLEEAKSAFQETSGFHTYRNEGDDLLALRTGMDRDCVMVYELGDCVGNFVNQLAPLPDPRHEVTDFSQVMEIRLKLNERKGHWGNEHHEFLTREMVRNFNHLFEALGKEDKDKDEITKRCANVANFAMMIADNEGNIGGYLK